MIIVYSKDMCTQCDVTKKSLESKGFDFEVIDVMKDEGALNKVREMGYTSMPVVIAGEEHWSGFRPDKIAALQSAMA